jgi:hypothetical protein
MWKQSYNQSSTLLDNPTTMDTTRSLQLIEGMQYFVDMDMAFAKKDVERNPKMWEMMYNNDTTMASNAHHPLDSFIHVGDSLVAEVVMNSIPSMMYDVNLRRRSE